MLPAQVQRLFASMFVASLATMAATPASAGHSDVTISTAPTHNMALSNGVYSPTGADAVLNIKDLTNALGAGDLEVTTGSQHGDIVVEASFHWASSYGLTLDAFRSIRVNQPVTDAGAGALTLTTNDGGSNGHLQFSARGNISVWDLANALTINGKPYTLVNTVASLASAITANPSGNYALAASYDAKIDGTYAQSPITASFEGNLEGLGNAITNLSTHGGGFFAEIGSTASVSDFHLLTIRVSASNGSWNSVGGLAGASAGILYGDNVSGSVSGSSTYLGGLIGSGSRIIERCSSYAAINTRGYGSANIGGLVGQFFGAIDDSFATANVRAGKTTTVAGGLVGLVTGYVRHSYATGRMEGSRGSISLMGLGGLAGESAAEISDSWATGDVATKRSAPYDGGIGGLVGVASNSISGSFATGRVEAWGETASGGLIGNGNAAITNSYATGAVIGSTGILGGLVGTLAARQVSISSSYAIGRIMGDTAGGFSFNNYGDFSNDYWDLTTSGTTNGTGSGNVSGIAGLTTAQLQYGLPAGFDPKVWAQDRKINHGFPFLIANPPPK